MFALISVCQFNSRMFVTEGKQTPWINFPLDASFNHLTFVYSNRILLIDCNCYSVSKFSFVYDDSS